MPQTCAVRDDTHLSVAIRLLLPDIAATMDILPVVNGFVCNPELPVALALRATCELTFQSHKPYPRAAIIAIPCVGNPAPDKDTTLVKRWVRSPFQSKASEMSFQQGTTLMEIGAASYLKCTSNQSFLTMEDGKRIDPQPEKVVTKALADRGVPQPALPARVACVLSNVDPAHLRTHLHEPSHDFWSSLKKLASDAKIRLITPTELKEWQQTLRKRKQSEGPSQGSSSSHANSIRAIDVATITIDLQSFKAEGSKVSYLAPERFGPDQEGLAIMTKAAAEAFLPASRISAGPLAIAIVDTKPIAGFMAPAFNHEDQPVLVPTCLVNFGDVEIKFAADVPSTSMGAVASCVVEFWVRRDLAAQWKDVADHMQYLGVHLPELRNGKVMATWSAKFFSKDRKPAPHDKAAYLHGFFRLPMTVVDPVLARSGNAGIFLTPKGDDKKPHQAFAIIPLPTASLDDAVAKATSDPNILGVVEHSQHFALRCRRENLQKVRKILTPESLFVPEGEMPPDSEAFHLKHLTDHTTPEALTAALAQLGWNAKAVRPVNQSTWLITAKHTPPARHLCINGSFVVVVSLKKPCDTHPQARPTGRPVHCYAATERSWIVRLHSHDQVRGPQD
ncbi:unnamed protein product [Effrenium voratum]|uniref:Uncharacterized protein n=1 Tax=Effrenium voratum TaxID=2562239 RepID=A0AA36JDM4_9DINO|nr:unnamed protein product [Effrenium voratum]CAJ1432781.1 unnamed protein product [Effrenium voratum]